MEPRGVLSLSYLRPRLSSSFSSSSSSPLLSLSSSRRRPAWGSFDACKQGNSAFPRYCLYFCCIAAGRGEEAAAAISFITSQLVDLPLLGGWKQPWHLIDSSLVLGVVAWFLLVITVKGFRTLKGTLFSICNKAATAVLTNCSVSIWTLCGDLSTVLHRSFAQLAT